MSTDPEQIRSDIAALLTDLPDPGVDGAESADIEVVAACLEQAHELLVRALESVEGRGEAIREH